MILWLCCYLGFAVVNLAAADILIKDNGQKIIGEMTLIAKDYIEFKVETTPGYFEWMKVPKQELLAVIGKNKKILYPRDKYDEISINYGKVKLRNSRDEELYHRRQEENLKAQTTLEKEEKNHLKTAALLGGIGGLMIWTLIDGK